jgi:hypothetical protein
MVEAVPSFPVVVFPAGRATHGVPRGVRELPSLREGFGFSKTIACRIDNTIRLNPGGITDVAYIDISMLFGVVSGCTNVMQSRRCQARFCFVGSRRHGGVARGYAVMSFTAAGLQYA